MIYEKAMLLVTALRSGEYKQLKHKLANNDRSRHCCLGVACELAIKSNVKLKIGSDVDIHNTISYNDESSILPEVVKDFFGFQSFTGKLSTNLSLTSMNDSGSSFNDIADIIEKNWQIL